MAESIENVNAENEYLKVNIIAKIKTIHREQLRVMDEYQNRLKKNSVGNAVIDNGLMLSFFLNEYIQIIHNNNDITDIFNENYEILKRV